jgi:hypothetical protein
VKKKDVLRKKKHIRKRVSKIEYKNMPGNGKKTFSKLAKNLSPIFLEKIVSIKF